MSEQRKIVELTDNTGVVFPLTHINAVVDSSNTPLNEILENIQTGNANLSDIRAAIADLQNQIYPLTSSLRANKSVWEYTGSKSYLYEGQLINSIEWKGDSVNIRETINSLSISSNSLQIGNINKTDNKWPSSVIFRFSASESFFNSYYESHTATLKITLNDFRTTEASCSVSLVAPSWIGWGPYSELSSDWLDRTFLSDLVTNKYMIKKTSTNLAGDYTYDSVPKGYSFWTIIPVSSKYTGHSEVITSNFPVAMKKMSAGLNIYGIDGITYKVLRNDSGGLSVGDQSWKMTLK